MENTKTYEETFKVRSSEVTPDGRARMASVCEWLQETAGNHALLLNFDISQLNQKKLTWVLHRLHVQIDRYPEWRDEVTIRTWPSAGDTLRAYRDFVILDSKGEELGRSLSYWLMLNMETRRPVRMPREVLDMAPSDVSHVLDIKEDRLTFKGEPDLSKTYAVRRSDLDINRHVNNVKYVEWALESMPEDQATEIDIEFRSECRLGDQIHSEVVKGPFDSLNYHRLVRTGEQKTAAVAISR